MTTPASNSTGATSSPAGDYVTDFSCIAWLDEKDWVFKPSQSRSIKTLQKILTTSKQLFITQGFEETTLANISKQSGVSIGSIYNLFSDKSSILLALFEHYRLNRVSQINTMVSRHDWPNGSGLDIIKFHFEIIFSSSRKDGGFLRLIERQRMVDIPLYETQAESEEQFCRMMVDLYRARAEDFDHPDLEAAVRYVHYIIRGSALWSILPPPGKRQFLDISDRAYQTETIRMASNYLGLRGT